MKKNYSLKKPLIADTKIRDICYRMVASKGILLCLELGIFDFIGEKARSLEEVAHKFDLVLVKAQALLSICCAEKLINYKKKLYYPFPIMVEYLCKNSPFYYGDFMKFLYIDMDSVRSYTILKNSICNNMSAKLGEKLFEKEFYSSNIVSKFAYAMHSKSLAPSKIWPECIELTNKRTFIDVGGGLGTHAIAACEKYENLNAIILDKKEVIELGNKFITNTYAHKRIQFLSCDFLKEDIPRADVYFLSDILHDWKEQVCKSLLKKIYDKLDHKGVIIIHEIFFNNMKTGSMSAAAYNLSMNIFSEGNQYSKKEVFKMLKELGFVNVKYKDTFGDWGIIIALRP